MYIYTQVVPNTLGRFPIPKSSTKKSLSFPMLIHIDKAAAIKFFNFNQLKLNKMKKISFSVALATYHVLNGHMWLVAPMVEL